MTRITTRFVLFIATAAVLPLVVYGVVSVTWLRSGTNDSVQKGNSAVAHQVSERISEYFDNGRRVLQSIGAEINGTQLEAWQRVRILRNHVLDFPEFREVSVLDGAGRVLDTSRVSSESTLDIKGLKGASAIEFFVAPPHLDTDGLPTTTIAVPLKTAETRAAWIAAEISLEELWRAVDSIRVGKQ